MKPFRQLSESYKRWRHTRGYGVHSPFAYRVVSRVIHPRGGYGYYGYERIEESLSGESTRTERREARMLLRLAADAAIRSAYVPAGTPQAYVSALLGAASSLRITHDRSEAAQCDIVAAVPAVFEVSALAGMLERTEPPIIVMRGYGEPECLALFGALREGIMLYGPHNALLIPRAGVQKVKYTVMI